MVLRADLLSLMREANRKLVDVDFHFVMLADDELGVPRLANDRRGLPVRQSDGCPTSCVGALTQ